MRIDVMAMFKALAIMGQATSRGETFGWQYWDWLRRAHDVGERLAFLAEAYRKGDLAFQRALSLLNRG